MREFELEEGEDIRGYSDNDENVDPDKDFSYIDKRLQDVLGQYQRDFMGGLSAENLGARYGGYGSFLPAYQRSPSALSHVGSESHFSSRSPKNVVPQKTIVQANESHGRRGFSRESAVQSLTVPVTYPMDYPAKHLSAGDATSDEHEKLPNNQSTHNCLKFRVTVGSENVLPGDNSEIYSGLGLDMSPSSSPEDSPFEFDWFSHGVQEMSEGSPSCIIKIMTSFPAPDAKFLSPLHGNFVCLVGYESNHETARLSLGEKAVPLVVVHERIPSERKAEVIKERKVRQKDDNGKAVEVEKENYDGEFLSPLHGRFVCSMGYESNPDNVRPGPGQQVVPVDVVQEINPAKRKAGVIEERMVTKKYDNGKAVESGNENDDDFIGAFRPCSMRKEFVSRLPVEAFGVLSEGKDLTNLMRKVSFSKHSLASNEENEVGCMVEVTDKSLKQHQVAADKAKGRVRDSVFSQEAGSEERGRIIRPKEKGQNDKKGCSRPRNGGANETSEVGCTDSNKSLKLLGALKHNKRKDVLDSPFQEVGMVIKRKANRLTEKIPNDKRRISSVLQKDSKENRKLQKVDCLSTHGMKNVKNGPVEPLKGYFDAKPVTYLQVGAAVPTRKEQLFLGGKKKQKSQNDVKPTADLPNVSVIVDSSAAQMEGTVPRGNFPSKSKRELSNTIYISRELVDETNFRKTDNVMAVKNSVPGVSEEETCMSSVKLKEKAGGEGTQTPSNVGLNLGANSRNHKPLTEMASTSGAPRIENSVVYEEDNWVQCDRCQKWRLLPYAINPNCLPQKWICRMLNWLPGMNKCSVSETATTNALLAPYQVPAPVLETWNIKPGYPNGDAVVSSANAHNGCAASQLNRVESVPCGVKNRHFQELNSKDQQLSSEHGNSKKLSQSSFDFNSVQRNVDAKQKTGKKRVADQDASGVPKKLKRVPQHFVDVPKPSGSSTRDGRDSQKCNLTSSEVSKDFAPYSSLASPKKIKDRSHKKLEFDEHEIRDRSGRKSKLKDQHNNVILAEAAHPKEWNSLDNLADVKKNIGTEQRKERRKKRSMGLDSLEMEPSAWRGSSKNNTAVIRDNAVDNYTFYGGGEMVGRPVEQHHWSTISQKAPDRRKCSKQVLDLGLPADAATPNSPNISGVREFQVKPHQIKCSSVDSVSSSTLKFSRSDHDRDKNISHSHDEPEELFPVKGMNCKIAIVSHDSATCSDKMRSGKSSTMRNSDIKPHLVDLASQKKQSTGHEREKQPDCELYKDDSKLDSVFPQEGIANAHQNLSSKDPGARSLNRLDLGKTDAGDVSFERGKLKSVPQSMGGMANPSWCSKLVSKSDKGDRSENMAAHNSDVDLHKQLRDGEGPDGQCGTNQAIVRPWRADGIAAAKDIVASSSARKDGFDGAAKTALREAKDLKHCANRLKISGSGLESTEVFFQAALKFLHGASLLEPGNRESARCGEMTSIEVYNTTAKLCEYCACEYERCNDMASAALAYKCMEVACMQVVYSRDPVAGRDRQELQMAIRIPQVDSPSSSASDIDNLNNQAATNAAKELCSPLVHGSHVISAGNMGNFVRLLNFAQDVNLAMEASRKCQSAFAAAHFILSEAGNEDALSSIKRVMDFSFHDVDGLLCLVRLASETLGG
ncbi:hypothetical protein Ancab_000736 [Ancistrocladus abbreviatus]